MANKRIDDGGAAFPTAPGNSSGMSIRHWIAGLAISELIAGEVFDSPADAKKVAKQAFWIADEMIAASLLGPDELLEG